MTMTLPELGVVRLTTDRYADRGVCRNAIGTIVLLHDDAYEVEFSRPDGTTIDWFAVRPDEIELIQDPPDAVPVRRAG